MLHCVCQRFPQGCFSNRSYLNGHLSAALCVSEVSPRVFFKQVLFEWPPECCLVCQRFPQGCFSNRSYLNGHLSAALCVSEVSPRVFFKQVLFEWPPKCCIVCVRGFPKGVFQTGLICFLSLLVDTGPVFT